MPFTPAPAYYTLTPLRLFIHAVLLMDVVAAVYANAIDYQDISSHYAR